EALYEQTDKTLLTQLRELEQETPAEFAHSIEEAKERQNISCIIYDANGTVLAQTGDLPADALMPPAASSADRSQLSSVNLPVLRHQRLLRATVHNGANSYPVLL